MFSDFTIILPLKVREKIQYFVDKADKEISGLGDATINLDAKTVTVSSAFLLDQECTFSTTDLCENAVSKAMYEAHTDEQKGITRNIKFWWHSHVNMQVFWSGTDTTTMKELSEAGWFVNIVFNKKREMLGAVSYPVEMTALGITKKSIQVTSGIEVLVPGLFTADEIKVLDKEMTDKYKEKTYGHNRNYSYLGGSEAHKDQQKILTDYYESIYGPNFADIDKYEEEEYEVGEILPNGTFCLHWDKELQIICFEGTATDCDDVWFRTPTLSRWVSIETDAHLMTVALINTIDIEALEAIYDQLDDSKEYPQKAKIVKTRLNKQLKRLKTELKSARVKRETKDAPAIIIN